MRCPLGALETKSKAMEVGIQFALDVGVCDVIFEGDARVYAMHLEEWVKCPRLCKILLLVCLNV